MSDNTNQTNYQDTQNFDIDINSVYNDFIIAIDNIRSYANTSAISNQSAINVFKSGDITLANLKSQVSVASILQESRCHAFYRIIGFPVVSSSFQIYNPGYDTVYDSSRSIGPAVSSTKLSIAGNPIDKFRDLSLKRENYFNSMTTVFSLPSSIDAGALALSVSARLNNNLTPFSVPLIKSSDPFDMDPKNQQYKADFTSLVGINSEDLTNYVDVLGDNPETTNLQPQRTHIIKPFIVDPVIDFLVNDASKLVSVPFVPSKSNLMVKDGVFVNRPIIEKVIRDRFTVADQSSTIGTSNQAIVDYIKSIPSIQNESIINQISSGDVYSLSDQTQFVKYINIIRAMMSALVDAQLVIRQAQEKYYWVPIPSISGPEGGSTVQGVFLSAQIPSDFITIFDQTIIEAKLQVTVNQINAQTSGVQGVPDIGGFSFDSFNTTFGPDSSGALGDISSASLQKLTNTRISDLKKANDALRTVEIIIGEFSGLGLCDIIAIMGALYIMPSNDLLGFLDADSLSRMNTSLNLSESSSGVQTAMTSFTSTVKDFYNLMDDIYQDQSQNNGLQ